MLWKNQKISCLIESTTYCNAKCPQCSRTSRDGLNFSNICELKHVTLSEWIESYAKSYEHIDVLHFSGNWGDCFMNPEIEDIFKHIRENSDCQISFSTNGSLRNPDFFWRIGVDNYKRISGTFDVDGFSQKNHEMYRRNTNLDKVKENAETFAATNNYTKIFTIVFKHNQDEVESISKWAEEIGAKHEILQSNRFKYGSKDTYTYEDVEYTLEQTTKQEYYHHVDVENIGRKVRDHRHFYKENNDIQCTWGLGNKVYVDEYQNVWPCCYWHLRAARIDLRVRPLDDSVVFDDYFKNIKKRVFNLKDFTLKEILQKQFYRKDLVKSFNEEPYKICNIICGV